MTNLTLPADKAPATLKLLLMGDSGVGKSSVLLRFVEDKFLGEEVHAATIGVDFKIKFLDLEKGERVKLTIWDTAGQERFRTLTSSYYRGAQGVILVYDVCSRDSFASIQSVWLRELTIYAEPEEMILMVVANKIDKKEERQVSKEEGLEFAKSLSALYMECSAKTKVGVHAAFEELVHTIMNSPILQAARREAQEKASARQLRINPAGHADAENGRCAC